MLKKFNFEEFKNLLLSDEKIICCSNYFEGITRNFFIVKIPVHKDLTFVYETSVSLGSEELVFPHNFLIPNKELEYVGMVVKGELVNISFPSFLFHRNYTDRNESECFNNEREQTWEKKRIFREICIRKIADYCEKKVEALDFARIDSMQSPSIPLYGVIKKQDRERIKQILENESKYYFGIPISAVQKISYRKNVLWERK